MKAIQEAVTIRQQLAEDYPDRYNPNLAGSLNNLSIRLAENDDSKGALKAIQEAVTIKQQLAEDNPARYKPELARSLQTCRTGSRKMMTAKAL